MLGEGFGLKISELINRQALVRIFQVPQASAQVTDGTGVPVKTDFVTAAGILGHGRGRQNKGWLYKKQDKHWNPGLGEPLLQYVIFAREAACFIVYCMLGSLYPLKLIFSYMCLMTLDIYEF